MPDSKFPQRAPPPATSPCRRASTVWRRSCCRSGGRRRAHPLVCDRLRLRASSRSPRLYRGDTNDRAEQAEQKMMRCRWRTSEGHVRRHDYLDSHRAGGTGVARRFCSGGGLSLWAAANCPQIGRVTYYY